jgi:hypothetical protein
VNSQRETVRLRGSKIWVGMFQAGTQCIPGLASNLLCSKNDLETRFSSLCVLRAGITVYHFACREFPCKLGRSYIMPWLGFYYCEQTPWPRQLYVCLFVCFVFVFQDRVSLYSSLCRPGWPRIQKSTCLPPPTPPVLGLKACVTTAWQDRQGLGWPRAHYGPGWPWTHRDLFASASWVLGLQQREF